MWRGIRLATRCQRYCAPADLLRPQRATQPELRLQFDAEGGGLLVAAVVAGLLDERFGFVEMLEGAEAAGHDEVIVCEVEPHAGAGGDFVDFGEVGVGGSG